MKKRLLMMFALLAMTFAAGAQSIFSENFDNVAAGSVPDGWAVYGDGVANADAYASYGDSWSAVAWDDEHGTVMYSVSWLNPEQNADRWLITPAITIPSDGEYALRFKAFSADAGWPEMWRVLVSVGTDTVKEGFTDEVLDLSPLTHDWSTYIASLAAYAGQTVRIAFVSEADGYYGMLDDVEVGVFDMSGISLTAVSSQPYADNPGSLHNFSYTVKNTGASDISEFQLVVNGVNTEYVSDFYPIYENIAPYESKTFGATVSVPYEFGTYTYSVRVFLLNDAGDTVFSPETLTFTVTVYDAALAVDRTVLVEDFETAQTVWTPQAEQRLAEGLAWAGYPDNVVHITHHAGYYTDPMTSGVSQSMLALYDGVGASTWAPALAIDRTQGAVPDNDENGVVGSIGQYYDIANQIEAARAVPSFASVAINNVNYDSDTRTLSVTVSAEATDASMVDALLCVYIVEDSIVSPQYNANNEWDYNYVHNNVVRDAISDHWGNWYGFSSTGMTYTYILSEEWDASHCRVVAFLTNNGVDVLSRYVLNATQSGYITNESIEPVVAHEVTATIENPQGGYIYYRVYGTDGNQVSYGRAMQGTTEVAFTTAQTLCVEYADINPMRQQSVIITPGTEYLDTARVNGEPYVFGSDEINDSWDEYGYRIYSVCGTYDSNVTFTASYLPYVITDADTADATLVVVNNGNGYARRYDPSQGTQTQIANTQYYTLEEGEEFIFTFGSFDPAYFAGTFPDSSMRLLHLYVDGVEIDFNDPETPGISIFNHTADGYSFYNYNYIQDSAKHRIEFVFGPYVDTTVCEPVGMPLVSATDEAAYVMWMPSPSAESYTVLFLGEPYAETTENSVNLMGLSALTEYTVFIVAHCYNGVDDTLEYVFTTLAPYSLINVSTNGGYLYSYQWGQTLSEGAYAFDGYGGQTVFWAETESYEYATNVTGIDPSRAVLEAIYVNGVSIALDSTTPNLTIHNSWDEEGFIGYEYSATFGEVDSIRFVYGPAVQTVECAEVQNLDAGNWTNESFSITWDAPVTGEGLRFVVTLTDASGAVLVNDTTYETYYNFTGLVPGSEFNYSVAMVCEGEPMVVYGSTITGGEEHTLTVNNVGNGYMANYNGARIYDNETYTGYEGFMYQIIMYTFSHETNANNGYIDANAEKLQHLYFDGVELDLTTDIDTSNADDYWFVKYDYTDNGYTVYVLYVMYNADHTVTAEFGPTEGYETECNPVSNWWVDDIDSTTATLYWEAPAGNTGVYYIEMLGNVIDSVESTDQYPSFNFWGLSSGTTYYGIYIKSKCSNGSMVSSDEVTFTTLSGGSAFTEYNTFTVTKNGNGYLYYYMASDEDNGSMIMGSGTTTYSVGDGDMVSYEAATFDPSRLSDLFGGTDVIGMGLLDADALTVQSIYLDGQMIDISNTYYDEFYSDYNVYVTYGGNYTLYIYARMEQNGYTMYEVDVNSDGDHQLVFNYGEGETPESYYVSFSSNNPALGEVISNVGNGSYTEGTQIESYAIVQGGVTFVGWAIDNDTNIVSQSNPLQMGVDTNMNIIGVFTTASVVTVPVHDTLYIGGTDTVYLYSIDTVYRYLTDTVYLIDTVYMGGTDTVYITDTVYVGVDDVEPGAEVKLYSQNSQIVVEGAQGHDVVLYDAVGRRLAARRDDYGLVRFEVPASGVYLVRVGQKPARRIVVVK